jgi:hypothetical protein
MKTLLLPSLKELLLNRAKNTPSTFSRNTNFRFIFLTRNREKTKERMVIQYDNLVGAVDWLPDEFQFHKHFACKADHRFLS